MEPCLPFAAEGGRRRSRQPDRAAGAALDAGVVLLYARLAQAQIAISPMSGEEVESFTARMTSAPAAVVERARAAVLQRLRAAKA
jgi:hypothetical protein